MAAPELRLDVRLNLATFRTDLGKAAQAAAAYYYPINLLINKENLTKQLTAIGRSLGATKYNIDLNDTSVDLAAGKIDKLAASLKKLSGSIQIDFNAGGGTKSIGTAMKEMAAKLAKESKGDINRAVEQMTGMRGASPFGAGTRSIPGFKAAAKGMGIENAFKLFFQELQQVDPQSLKKALDDGSVMMMQENRELKQKFDKIQSSAEGLAQDLRAMGETAKITGKASLTADGKTLYPQNYGLKIASLLSQVEKLDKDLRRVSTESGGELLNTLTELSSVLRTTSNSFVGIAGFSKNLDETLRGFDVATKAATRATTAYADRITRRGGGPAEATAGPRLLSGGEAGGALVAPLRDDPYRVIQAQVKNAFDIIEDYHKRQSETFINGYRKIIEDHHRKILIQLAKISEYRPAQKLLSGTPPRLALPPVGGASTPERRVRITTGAYLGQPSMMRAPSVPPSMGGGGAPPVPPRGGGAVGGGGASFGGMQFNVPKLPGAGLVREIGTEFGFAAKQVLLFGTAYKALAFIQGFPAQVGAAVGALQSFRNTIKEISPSAEEAAESSQFILDVVDKYNTPIQSARDGFTKLYASMKPTGFSGDEIRDLFLGITQAAATFGMSAEKVDRVNYAFAQMASKGQVMSEELKGQLGDVLPGAMGIFAEAAGFEGPDAITKFSKALEDGAYKGGAMKTLLTSVGAIMRKEFGPGAEGAARTFQGVINRMQNSFKLLYESFEPVAVGFLNSVVMPLTSGIKTVTDGFNAFFTGTLAKTEGGAAFAQQLNNLKPSFEGIRANLAALIPSFQTFGQLLLSVAQFLTQLAGNPITGFLLKVYTNVLLVNTSFTLLGGRILLGLIANVNAAIIRFVAFGYAINAVGVQTTGANTALAGTQLQMMLLQRSTGAALAPVNALLGSLARIAAIGTIAVVLTIAISNMNELRDAEARLNRLRGAKADSVVGPTGPRPIQTAQARFAGASRETIEEARGKQTKYLTDLTLKKQALERKLQSAQGENLAAMADANSASITTAGNRLAVAQANLNSINKDIENAQEVLRLDPRNYRRQAEINRSSTPGISATSGGGGGTAAGGTKPKQERESQVPLLKLELQYQKELLPLESEINRARLLDDNLAVIRLENDKNMLDLKYEALRVNLEDIPVAEKRLKIETLQSKGQMAALKTRYDIEFEIAKILEEHDKTLESMEDKSNLELLNRKSYIELLLNGIKPAHAKITIEVENEIAALTTSLELRRQNLEEEIKLLQAKKAGGGKIDEDRLTELQSGLGKTRQKIADLPAFGTGETARRLAIAEAPKLSQEYTAEGLESAQDRLKELMNTGYQVVQAANAIGSAFGEAFKGLITGSMTAQEALAGFFQSIADHFADMVAQMIAEYLKMALIKGIMSLIPGLGSFAGGANIGQSVAMPSSAGMGAGGGILQNPMGQGVGTFGPNFGIRQFANGGMVTGPTLGLVGEGRYNEAIIPLPDGKSVPVQLSGGAGGNAAPINTSIVVNVKNGQAESQMSGNQGNQLARELEGAVRQVILKESRPGGLISSSR